MCDRIHRRGEEGMSIATVWLLIRKKAGARGISIAVIIHSFDRTLHIAIAVAIRFL